MSPGALSPEASDDLNRSIESSVAQASVMWLLHRQLVMDRDRDESLEQQIVEFSAPVFDAITTSNPILRHAKKERLWLIYFKGLLNSNTHSREEMVRALRHIASAGLVGASPQRSKQPAESSKLALRRAPVDDDEALEQIARGLGQNG